MAIAPPDGGGGVEEEDEEMIGKRRAGEHVRGGKIALGWLATLVLYFFFFFLVSSVFLRLPGCLFELFVFMQLCFSSFLYCVFLCYFHYSPCLQLLRQFLVVSCSRRSTCPRRRTCAEMMTRSWRPWAIRLN